MSGSTTSNPDLVRALSLYDAVAVVVGTVVGSGIFLVPAEMMQAVGSATTMYLAWTVGGVLSLFGVLTYAELSALKPETGGEYVYLRDAYGPLTGFLYGWTFFVIAKPGSIATVATGFVRVLSRFESCRFLGQGVGNAWHMSWQGISLSVALVALISFINYVGIKRAAGFQVLFTAIKIAIILAVVVIGFTYAHDGVANIRTTYHEAKGGLTGFMMALLASLWAYDGWNDVTSISGEVKNPRRNLPIALIAGMFILITLYLSLTAAIQRVLPADALAGSESPVPEMILLTAGTVCASIVSAGIALAMLTTINGAIMTGARIPFAVARDGYFFSALGTVHPRFYTPSISVVIQGVLASVMLLFARTFQQLFSLTLFAEWLFYMTAASTIFIFRRRMPDVHRAYRTWGYPIVPTIFIAVAAFLLYSTFADNFRPSLLGSSVILAGVPVFFVFRKRERLTSEKTPSLS